MRSPDQRQLCRPPTQERYHGHKKENPNGKRMCPGVEGCQSTCRTATLRYAIMGENGSDAWTTDAKRAESNRPTTASNTCLVRRPISNTGSPLQRVADFSRSSQLVESGGANDGSLCSNSSLTIVNAAINVDPIDYGTATTSGRDCGWTRAPISLRRLPRGGINLRRAPHGRSATSQPGVADREGRVYPSAKTSPGR